MKAKINSQFKTDGKAMRISKTLPKKSWQYRNNKEKEYVESHDCLRFVFVFFNNLTKSLGVDTIFNNAKLEFCNNRAGRFWNHGIGLNL